MANICINKESSNHQVIQICSQDLNYLKEILSVFVKMAISILQKSLLIAKGNGSLVMKHDKGNLIETSFRNKVTYIIYVIV